MWSAKAFHYFLHTLKGNEGLASVLDSVLQSDFSEYFTTKSSEDLKELLFYFPRILA